MTNDYGAAVGSGPAPAAADPTRAWVLATMALAAAVFIEAVFAGAMLSGAGWARAAHAAAAGVMVAAAAGLGVVALVTLRHARRGPRLAWSLLAVAGAMLLQAALGAATAKGANLLWLHVPLGVALVGLAGQAVAAARRLAQP